MVADRQLLGYQSKNEYVRVEISSCWGGGKEAFNAFHKKLSTTTFIGTPQDLENEYNAVCRLMFSNTAFLPAVQKDIEKYLNPLYDEVLDRLVPVDYDYVSREES